MDLVNELFAELELLNRYIKQMAQVGKKLAQAERKYKESLAIKTAELRDENVAVGIIDKRIYGLPPVSDLREQRDVQKVLYDYFYNTVLYSKIKVKVLQSQIEREWSNAN